MELDFETTFEEIVLLNGKEGPSRNIFEPKFEARERLLPLMTVLKLLDDEPSLGYLSRCFVLLGTNMIETDEDKEGFENLRRAYTCIDALMQGGVAMDRNSIPCFDLNTVLSTDSNLLRTDRQMAYAAEYMDVMNNLGLYFSNSQEPLALDNAKKFLRLAEGIFDSWNEWFRQQPDHCVLKQVAIGDDGKVLASATEPNKLASHRLRLRMENYLTTTIFLLSQVYGQGSDPLAVKYCHYTLRRQLMCKQEFSRKTWAVNALQLSTYYLSVDEIGKAWHCVEAAAHVMPKDNPSEETLGFLAWYTGRFHLGRLQHGVRCLSEGATSRSSRADSWWVSFDLPIEEPKVFSTIHTFEEARDIFKLANAAFTEALSFYVMDGCCTDHIAIQQDIGTLYKLLSEFEENMDRKIAMLQRRVAFLETVPDQLNFQSYAVLIRQTLFDVGDMYSDIVELRYTQKKELGKHGKPLSDSKHNELVAKAMGFFDRFCKTFHLPGCLIEKEDRTPYFRALMRIAHLQAKCTYKTPEEEYHGIGKTISCYETALNFSKKHELGPDAATELRLAQEMTQLLPTRQKELWLASRR